LILINFCLKNAYLWWYFFLIGKLVCYIHEIVIIKHAEPNQACYFVHHNRVFIIIVIASYIFNNVVTEIFMGDNNLELICGQFLFIFGQFLHNIYMRPFSLSIICGGLSTYRCRRASRCAWTRPSASTSSLMWSSFDQ